MLGAYPGVLPSVSGIKSTYESEQNFLVGGVLLVTHSDDGPGMVWAGRVCNSGLIVAVDIRGSINGDTHHTKFIPQPPQLFHTVLHCDKFSTKNRGLDGRLFLGEPVDACHC